jgi:hypothetical protein
MVGVLEMNLERDKRARNLMLFEQIKKELYRLQPSMYRINPRALDQNAKIVYDERYPQDE